MNCTRCGEPLNSVHIVDGCPKRTIDEVVEQATKVMHSEVCCPCDPQGCDWTHTREARYAWALADAGLLARPVPSRDEIADVLSGWPIGTGYYQTSVAYDEARDMADAVLELLKGQDA